MKYLYFDCFAAFSPSMAAGALIDMGANPQLLEKIVSFFPEIKLRTSAVTRGAMEATLAEAVVPNHEDICDEKSLVALCDRLDVGECTKSRLASFVHTKAEARAIDPLQAQFFVAHELGDLAMAAYVFESVEQLGADKVLISRLFCTDAHAFDGNGFVPLTKGETRYICKKYNLPLTTSSMQAELVTEGGAALLSVLGAETVAMPRGSTIKVGYGAGACELESAPNIVRAVYGEDDGSEALFEAEAALGDIFAEFACMEA